MTRLTEIAATPAPAAGRPFRLARESLAGALLGGLALPALALVGKPIHASAMTAVLAALLACVVALYAWRDGARGIPAVVVSALAVVTGCFLLVSASYPGSGFVVAALLGAGLGPLLPRNRGTARTWAPSAISSAAALAVFRWQGSSGAAALAFAMLTLGAAGLRLATTRGVATPVRRRGYAITAATAALGAFAIFWVGSTAPAVTWFGALKSHGPRDVNEVAITFDDGPDPPYTLEIADILERYDARGTFFEVGKAVVQRPDVTKALIARGHVVGNHSYNHGAFSYLDPRYPELEQTQHAFRDNVGICPAIFRPPHGTHTPFMSHIVTDAGMTLATWDVSARDWVETDPDRLARDILAKVRPGSVILLHDGIDGKIGADRSVVTAALPKILEGLREKGLKPVTLDRLLGVPAVLPECR
jgi:peptidoglycan/xylan/chitin deacetylase (PgdA/CDA1 family)